MVGRTHYLPTLGEKVPLPEEEATKLEKKRDKLLARLKPLLEADAAAYRQAAADLGEGELSSPRYIYRQHQIDVLGRPSRTEESSMSKIPVFRDPVVVQGTKRKANDEVDEPIAKRQHTASSYVPPNARRHGQRRHGGGRGQSPKERSIMKPMSRVGRAYNGLTAPRPKTKESSRGKRNITLVESDSDPDHDVRSPVRPARHSVETPTVVRQPAEAGSAFSQLSERNKEVRKRQQLEAAVNQKLLVEDEKKNRNDEHGRRASRQASPKARNAALSKEPTALQMVPQLRDLSGPGKNWHMSMSTGPPITTNNALAIPQIHTIGDQDAGFERAGLNGRKRKAEEPLEAPNAKSAKQTQDRLPEYRSEGGSGTNASAKPLTSYEMISGEGKKPRKPDIHRVHSSRSVASAQKPRPSAIDEIVEDEKDSGTKRRSKDELDSSHNLKQSETAKPKGFKNFRRACFANAPLQCLLAVPEIANRYQGLARGVVSQVDEVIAECPDLDHKGHTTRTVGNQRYRVKKALEEHKEDISLSAYLGELIQEVVAGEDDPVSTFKFLQAFGTLVCDDGDALNGETSQEAKHFIDELLQRLEAEEQEQTVLEGILEKMTLIRELFGIKTSKHVYCAACRYSRDEEPFTHTSMNVVLPRTEEPTTLADLLRSTGKGQMLEDCKCPNPQCTKRNRTIERYQLEQTSKYLIVQAPRIGERPDKGGSAVAGHKGETISAKIHKKVQFPSKIIDLSVLLPEDSQQSEGAKYELFGMVMHRGANHYDGHYMALRKVGNQWWECNDEQVNAVADHDLREYDNGQLFFLRRVDKSLQE